MTLESVQPVPLTLNEGGTIRITGTRVSLESVIYQYQQGATAEQVQDSFPSLKLADIYAVISYYLNHRAEVDEYLRQQETRAEEVRRMIDASPLSVDRRGLRERLLSGWQAMQQQADNDHQE
ncbi:MAG TPA: DUF433 domain-containing protein [Blastocatellia bacterium]|nr:DUF433 domain-containing protein [Blastocatellia bacterium]